MKEPEGQNAEQPKARAPRKTRRPKWWILLLPLLALAAIAAVFNFRQEGINEQLRRLAPEGRGWYIEEVRGPEWYAKLALKCGLPIARHPVTFRSHKVTDKDMPIVGKATTLRDVGLYGSKISGAGVAYLAALSELQSLYLGSTMICDDDLVHLSELTELRDLRLDGTKVTNAGLIHLKKLRKLQLLVLSGTQVTDEGLPLLSGFQDLWCLDLEGTRVTDAGLVQLKSLKGLEDLILSGTYVTAEGIADLKSAIPGLKVTFK